MFVALSSPPSSEKYVELTTIIASFGELNERITMRHRKSRHATASVLIADADAHAARDLERELVSGGYYCVAVASAREAIAAARKRRFDVAVVDVDLGDLKGYQLIPLLKDVCEGTKMILSTSQHSEDVERRARQTGIVFYAIKANNMLEILSAVSSAVRAKRREEKAARVIG